MQRKPPSMKLDNIGDFEAIAQSVCERFYLIPFDEKKKKSDLYALPVERISHGAQHVSRAAAYIPILVNFFKQLGYPPEIAALTQKEVLLLQLATLFHDAGRKTDGIDHWEKESADLFKQFLLENGFDETEIQPYIEAITQDNKIVSIFDKLLQSADALDIMRVRKALDLSKVDLFLELKPDDKQKFYQLAFEIRALIAHQSDLKEDCAIHVGKQRIYKKIPATRDKNEVEKKRAYEQAPHCYKKVTGDFSLFPLLAQLYNNGKILQPHSFPVYEKEAEDLRADIRKTAQTLPVHSDYLLKAIRADNNNYFRRFVDMVLPPHAKYALREPGSKTKFTVTGEGVRRRQKEGELYSSRVPLKKPQYSNEEKKGYSKFQSTTLGTPDFSPAVFGAATRGQKLLGIIIDIKDSLLSNRLYIYDGGTYNRPYDHHVIALAKEYYQNKSNKILFSANQFEKFKSAIQDPINKNKYNEVLARIRWNTDGSSKIFIFSDTLEARLMAREYARIIKDNLLKNKICDENYTVPIYFYNPAAPDLHFKAYELQEQELDVLLAKNIWADKKAREIKYSQLNYEFLLALEAEELKEAIFDDFSGQPLILQILSSGYIHIVQSILEKTQLTLEEVTGFLSEAREDYQSSIITAIYNCINTDNIDLAEYLLKNYTAPSSYQDLIQGQENLLHLAARKGHLALVELILPKIENIDQPNHEGNTALMCACKYGHTSVANCLLSVPSLDVNATNPLTTSTALIEAASQHSVAIIALLKEKEELDLNSKNHKGWSALMIAASRGHNRVIDQLLADKRTEINDQDPCGLTALMYAVLCKQRTSVKKLLAAHNIEINKQDALGQTALMYAASSNHVNIVKELLAQPRIEINKKSHTGLTALHFAVFNNHSSSATILIKNKKIDINAATQNGDTALIMAAQNNNVALVKLLLAQDNIEVNARNIHGSTALQIAAREGHTEIVKLLLNTNKVDANVTDTADLSPFIHAALKNHIGIIRELLRYKTLDFHTKNSYDMSPMDFITSPDHRQIAAEFFTPGPHVTQFNLTDSNCEQGLKNFITHESKLEEVEAFLRLYLMNYKTGSEEQDNMNYGRLFEKGKKEIVETCQYLLDNWGKENIELTQENLPYELRKIHELSQLVFHKKAKDHAPTNLSTAPKKDK